MNNYAASNPSDITIPPPRTNNRRAAPPDKLAELGALLAEALEENNNPVHGPLGMGPRGPAERQLRIAGNLAEAITIVKTLKGDSTWAS